MTKDWIIGLKFVQEYVHERIRASEMGFRMSNFEAARKDILETMRDDLDEQAEGLAKKKLNDLLSAVDMNGIVTFNKQQGTIFIGGDRVTPERLSNLQSESEALQSMDIWRLIYETPKELAQRSMFVQGETLADMQKGRTMLYLLSTQKNILDIFRKPAAKASIPQA